MCDTMVDNNIIIMFYCIVNNNMKNLEKSKPPETLKIQRFKAIFCIIDYFDGTNNIIPINIKVRGNA